MEFSLANKFDTAAIREIWHDCFQDPYPYIDFFLEKRYNLNHCYVCRVSGKVVSMLHALPCKILIEGQHQTCWYLYAVATREEYRNRGMVRNLTDFVIQQGEKQGISYFCLLPANSGLYHFYEKLNFRTFFYREDLEIQPDSLVDVKFHDFSLSYLTELQKLALSDAMGSVSWDEQAVSYAVQEHLFTGGRVLCFSDVRQQKDMVAFAKYQEDGRVVVSEFFGHDLSALASAVKKVFPTCSRIQVSVSADRSRRFSPYGMLYTRHQVLIQENNLPYLGFTLS